jgi:RNA polymerase sigma-70 factor (ECF subfamily)
LKKYQVVSLEHLSDDILVEQLKKGRNEALDELYRRYASRIYLYCQKTAYHLSYQDLEDMVQDIFFKVIRSINSFKREKASFSTWIFRIAHNLCVDLIRKQGRRKTYSIVSAKDDYKGSAVTEETLIDPAKSIEQEFAEEQEIRELNECIERIDKDQEKQALLLYYINEKVYREIASIMKRSISMVRNLIKAAEEKVKECMEAKGLGEKVR